jgi:hypothetical protein
MPHSKTWKQKRIQFSEIPIKKDFDIFFKEELIDTHIIIRKIIEARPIFKKEDILDIEELLKEKINPDKPD